MSLLQRLKQVFRLGGMDREQIDMLSCAEVAELLYDYIDDELDPVTRAKMKSHFDMGECPCERALLFEIAFLDKVKGAAEPTQAPDALKQRIIDRLTDENA